LAALSGEEFAISSLPENRFHRAAEWTAERLRSAIAESSIMIDNDILQVTASIGVLTMLCPEDE